MSLPLHLGSTGTIKLVRHSVSHTRIPTSAFSRLTPSRAITITRSLHLSTPLNMSDPSKSKSDSEWRAVLSPEQVRFNSVFSILYTSRELTLPSLPSIIFFASSSLNSSAFSVKRGPNLPVQANITSSTKMAFTLAPDVELRCIRARPSSTVGVGGLRSSMVRKAPFRTHRVRM